jgi:hypothetical protein
MPQGAFNWYICNQMVREIAWVTVTDANGKLFKNFSTAGQITPTKSNWYKF